MPNTPAAIYLDHAAATPLEPAVLAAMQPYLEQQFYNPSATYQAARRVRAELEAARQQVAHWLGAKPPEIIFTAGGTEANNLAIHGIMQRFPAGNVVVSSIEHESVLEPAAVYERRLAAVHPDGRLNLQDLQARIDAQTVLVSIMYANNEVGSVQPLRDVAQLVREERVKRGKQGLPLYFHTDAAQAGNYLDLHVHRLGVDLLTMNGGKIYGPKQSGALYVATGTILEPWIRGGGQERGLRSGTENVAQAVGLAAALEQTQGLRHTEAARLRRLQQQTMYDLETSIKGLRINGSHDFRLPNNLHLSIDGVDNERLLMALDERGIQAAAGSACSASSETPSHVLQAMGYSEAQARSSIRCTMGRSTTAADLQTLVESLKLLTT